MPDHVALWNDDLIFECTEQNHLGGSHYAFDGETNAYN